MKLHAKFGKPRLYGYSEGDFKDFQYFFSVVPMATKVLIGSKLFD